MGTLEEVGLELSADAVDLTADGGLVEVLLIFVSYFRVGQLEGLLLDLVGGRRVGGIESRKIVGFLRQKVVQQLVCRLQFVILGSH